MVRLHLREFRIRVTTEVGDFGTDISFPDGLVVMRAENSAGKSTLVQSIIYVLGLEGMLSASREVPLPHAMTHNIEEGNDKYSVQASRIWLEIENHHGQRVVVSRAAKADTNRNLISIIHGPALSKPQPNEPYKTEDKFVRDPGAAQSEIGFHRWLASFLDWKLPIVPKFDGGECPLYLECMFPIMLVEQKKAWTGIQARMPTQFRIRDVSKRAIEFILDLSVFATVTKRQQLRDARDDILRRWSDLTTRASASARQANGIVYGIDESPMEKWPDAPAPHLQVIRGKEWLSVDEAFKRDRELIHSLSHKEIPTVAAVANELTDKLTSEEENLAQVQIALSEVFEDVRTKRAQLDALNQRLDALSDSLEGNKNIRKLRRMGSIQSLSSVHEKTCPTCHQTVDEVLLPQDKHTQPMSLEDNIAFIESQQEIYRATRDSLNRAITSQEALLSSLRNEDVSTRARIRALKESLLSEGHTPSREAIEALVAAKDRLIRTQESKAAIDGVFDALKSLTTKWRSLMEEIKVLPKDDLSSEDREKIKQLQALFRELAKEFGVTSLDPNTIELSTDTYRPVHEGFDLEFDLSASDLIRTIWSYLVALLELSRTEKTNHLGTLVLDEPRQQETKRESFGKFFKRTSLSVKFNEQVIVATSESVVTLKGLLEGLAHTYIQFDGDKILVRQGAIPA
jgi:hypothetical protein